MSIIDTFYDINHRRAYIGTIAEMGFAVMPFEMVVWDESKRSNYHVWTDGEDAE